MQLDDRSGFGRFADKMPAGNLTVCPVPFYSARAFVALGSLLVEEDTKCVCRQGLLRKELLLTAVGVEPKRGRISCRALFFIMDTT